MRKAGSFCFRSEPRLAPKIRRINPERFIPHGFIYGWSDLDNAPQARGEALKKVGLAK